VVGKEIVRLAKAGGRPEEGGVGRQRERGGGSVGGRGGRVSSLREWGWGKV